MQYNYKYQQSEKPLPRNEGLYHIINITSSTQHDTLSNNNQRLALRMTTRRISVTAKTMVFSQHLLPRMYNYVPHLTSSSKEMRKKFEIKQLICTTDVITTTTWYSDIERNFNRKNTDNTVAEMLIRPQRH